MTVVLFLFFIIVVDVWALTSSRKIKINKYKINKNNVSLYDREYLQNLTGFEFEDFCASLFRSMGYKNVEKTPSVNDEGRDLILTTDDGETIFVECKRYSEDGNGGFSKIGREIIQKLTGSMVGFGVKKGIVITTGSIHQNAWDFICKVEKNSDLKLDCIDMNEIQNILKRIGDVDYTPRIASINKID